MKVIKYDSLASTLSELIDQRQATEQATDQTLAALADALATTDVEGDYISYTVGQEPPSATVTGTIGAYFKEEGLFQKVEWSGSQWQGVGEPIVTRKYVDDKAGMLATALAEGGGLRTYLTRADMDADTSQDVPTAAAVVNDPDAAINGMYVWDGEAWVEAEGILRPDVVQAKTSVVVAASDAPANIKRGADFACDGVDDQSEIQAAINTGVSTVKLLAGNYKKSNAAGISIPSGTTLILDRGARIKLADAIDAEACIFSSEDTENIQVIGGGILDGNERNQSSGKMYAVDFKNVDNYEIDIFSENFRTFDFKTGGSRGLKKNKFFEKGRQKFRLLDDFSDLSHVDTYAGAQPEIEEGEGTVGNSCLSINQPEGSFPMIILDYDGLDLRHHYLQIDVKPIPGPGLTSIRIQFRHRGSNAQIWYNIPVGRGLVAGKWSTLTIGKVSVSDQSSDWEDWMWSDVDVVLRTRVAAGETASYLFDNIRIVPSPDRPEFSFGFDDQNFRIWAEYGAPTMAEIGYPVDAWIYTANAEPNLDYINTLYFSHGWHLLSHSYSHPIPLSGESGTDIWKELIKPRIWLEKHGFHLGAGLFKYPGHSQGSTTIEKTRKVYAFSFGGSAESFTIEKKPIPPYFIISFEPASSIESSLGRIERCLKFHEWGSFQAHQTEEVDMPNFLSNLEYLRDEIGIQPGDMSHHVDVVKKYIKTSPDWRSLLEGEGEFTLTDTETEKTVSHGLPYEPDLINLIPDNQAAASAAIWIEAKDDESFTVHVSSPPASTAAYRWNAKITS